MKGDKGEKGPAGQDGEQCPVGWREEDAVADGPRGANGEPVGLSGALINLSKVHTLPLQRGANSS